MSDIDIAVADSLKVLDLKRPIREATKLARAMQYIARGQYLTCQMRLLTVQSGLSQNPPAIAVIAGHAIERARRSGKSAQDAELVQFNLRYFMISSKNIQ